MAATPKVDREKLARLRNVLPKGSAERIAEKTEVPLNTVRCVLRGEYYQEAIIREAIRIVDETTNSLTQVESELEEAVQRAEQMGLNKPQPLAA